MSVLLYMDDIICLADQKSLLVLTTCCLVFNSFLQPSDHTPLSHTCTSFVSTHI